MYQYLKQSYEVVTLWGDDSESDRTAKWRILKAGNYQVLITTGQFFGEGTDLHNITCLFLVYPFSFEGKLIQYIGRVQRSEIDPIIYDYRDIKIDYLNKLFLKRNTYYRKLERQVTLFDESVKDNIEKKKVLAWTLKRSRQGGTRNLLVSRLSFLQSSKRYQNSGLHVSSGTPSHPFVTWTRKAGSEERATIVCTSWFHGEQLLCFVLHW